MDELENLRSENADLRKGNAELSRLRAAIGHMQQEINTLRSREMNIDDIADYSEDRAKLKAENEHLKAENEQLSHYKVEFQKALHYVDRVFQPSSENPSPLLPEFADLGSCKFEAVERLAHNFLALQSYNAKLRMQRTELLVVLRFLCQVFTPTQDCTDSWSTEKIAHDSATQLLKKHGVSL